MMLTVSYFIFTSQTQPIKKKKAGVLQSINQMCLDLENRSVFKTNTPFISHNKHKKDQ